MLRRETNAFDRVLEFWRLPIEPRQCAATLVERRDYDPALSHALVCLEAGGAPQLCRIEGRGFVHAPMRRIPHPPASLEPVLPLVAEDGDIVSWILEDRERHVVYLPFSPDAAVRAFQEEAYHPAPSAGRRGLLSAYYAVKPLIPRRMIMAARGAVARRQREVGGFPRWPLETSLDDLNRLVLELLLRVADADGLPFMTAWPGAAPAALILTHDVEGAEGRDMIEEFIRMEAEHGMVSSFNLVPSKYPVPDSIRATITAAGCEVGVHGWDHNGSLVASRARFDERLPMINEVGARWGASGFRSPSTYRHPEWFTELAFEYDSSFPDTDPYEPQPGGCVSIFPYLLGDLVELPITMPQDHTQFSLLGMTDCGLWRTKAGALIDRGGLVCMLTHPDTAPGYTGCEPGLSSYREMLRYFAEETEGLWNGLPADAAAWWRRRSATTVTRQGALEGPAAGDGSVKWAHLGAGRRLVLGDEADRPAAATSVA